MEIPWVGVLEDACTWASGKSTPNDVISSITVGLFGSGAFFYDGTTTLLTDSNLPRNVFDLTMFLGLTRPIAGQCYDVSDYECICLYTQGRQVEALQKWPQYQEITIITTNMGILIGNLDYFSQSTWSNHQFVRLLSGNIADPTIGLYSNNGIPAYLLNLSTYWGPSLGGLVQSISPSDALIPAYPGIVTITP